MEERFQISAGGRPIAEIVRTTSETKPCTSTPIASVQRRPSAPARAKTFEQRFDPFGAPDSSNATITRAGFTGHAHDNDLGLIDMKGRVYDPLASRFTTADPIMQAPYWSQGMNRYAYVFNDPLNATDPSGFLSMSDEVKGFVYGGTSRARGCSRSAPLRMGALRRRTSRRLEVRRVEVPGQPCRDFRGSRGVGRRWWKRRRCKEAISSSVRVVQACLILSWVPRRAEDPPSSYARGSRIE